MKLGFLLVLTAAACALVACEEDDQLTAEEAQKIINTLIDTANQMNDEIEDASQTKGRYSIHLDVNSEIPCPADGRISYVGNVDVFADDETGDVSLAGMLTYYVSDPTNNLNDCEVINGIVLDGEIFVIITGDNYDSNVSMNGTIGVNRKGDSGGLAPIDDECLIIVSCNTAGCTGRICEHTFD